ncbi:MAG: S-layer homology domain-containing protein [Defluviitaleaceae bacterium]|nr:S-layer homology domain-containing protein [Defluviitaleaceae bacterium]
MQKKKFWLATALLMMLTMLTIFTTSGSAFAATEVTYNNADKHFFYGPNPYPNGSVEATHPSHATVGLVSLPFTAHFDQDEYDQPYTSDYTSEEAHDLPYDSYSPYQLPHDPYADIWRQQVTGSFYNLHILSIEYGIITAIITQCALGYQFYATSDNFMHWEITGPVTSNTHTQEEYPLPLYEEYETPYISLDSAGITRIERLPYHIHDSIKWVGFVVMQDINGSTRREQLRIYMDGIQLNPLPPEPRAAIADMSGFGWAWEAIEFVVARDLMSMYLCTETRELIAFHPSGKASRGFVLAAAVKALDLSVPYFTEAVHTPFYDVPLAGRGAYIDIAKQLGLVVGVGNNRFAPNNTITRQDMMTMLYNIMMAMGQIQPDIGLTALGRFNDLSEISSYARLPISSLARAGIIAGDGVSINPREYVTRVEAAMFVRNLYRIGEV